jgi:hypothetical protein
VGPSPATACGAHCYVQGKQKSLPGSRERLFRRAPEGTRA